MKKKETNNETNNETVMIDTPITDATNKVVRINPFSVELGREDLNQLVAKVNEIVDFINK